MTDLRSDAAAAHRSGDRRADRPTSGQRFALVVGAVFLLVGILGFIPGVTQNFDDLAFAGHHSDAELLGLFQVSVLHNLVHVAFGVIGILAARRDSTSRVYLFVGGAVYLALAVYGAMIDRDTAANFVPVNSADDVLHLGLGVGMVILGAVANRTSDPAVRP